jgi:hypothetical protein
MPEADFCLVKKNKKNKKIYSQKNSFCGFSRPILLNYATKKQTA